MILLSRSSMNFVGILLLLTAFSSFAQSQLSSADKPIDLKTLQDMYAKAIQKVEGDNASAAQSLSATYVKELQTLQQTAKKAGDIEQLTAVNRELERFKTEQTVPDQPDASIPDAVKKLQTQYKSVVTKNDLEKNKKIVSITKQYLENLTSLQTNLTKGDKVNEALDVNAEIKRVKADSKVANAEFAVAAAETNKRSAETTDKQPSEKQPADQPKKTAEKEKMKVAITVDGADKIFVKSNELWIVHESFDLPRDIKIDGKKWICQWDNNTSDRYTKLDPPFVPRPGSVVDVHKLQGRSAVQLIQSPSSMNGFTAIILINDAAPGADKYAFVISW
jgi:hypothetical protein